MIDKNFFQCEMQKLIDQFGDKFSSRKIDLIYKALKRLDEHELAYIVDDIIGNNKFAPNVSEFVDKARQYLNNKSHTSSVECSQCGGGGALIVRKKTGEVGEYAFQCTCENGINNYPAFPKWYANFQKTYTRQQIPQAIIDKFYGREK
tara:strand:- start:30227 stop:30670 length:444 start_codon:yes stop_codon:yes gene_type:complete